MATFCKRFAGFWVGGGLFVAILFWPLAVWPGNPTPFFLWFFFLIINAFAAMFAAAKF